MKRWQFVPGAESIDPVGNGDVVLENVAVPTIGGPKPMVGTAASRRHDAEQQAPATHAHGLPVREWRAQRACGRQWTSGGGTHLVGSDVRDATLSPAIADAGS